MGNFAAGRQFHLPHENFLLHVARRMIVEIVQPDLAPGDYLGMLRQSLHVLICGFIRQPGLVRMDAERCVDKIVFLRQSNSAIHLRGPVAVADGDDGLHSGLASARNHLLAIGCRTARRQDARENQQTSSLVVRNAYVGTGTLPVHAEQSSARF